MALVIGYAIEGSNVRFLMQQPYRAILISDYDQDGNRRWVGFEAGSYTQFLMVIAFVL